MNQADQPRSVDELRSTLRELGYLDARVDRFVLSPAQTGRTLAGIAWRSSVRIGLLVALLLGPSAAVSLATRLPGLVVSVRDGLLLTLYLSVLFGLGAAGGAMIAIMVAGSLARRRPALVQAQPRLLAGGAGALMAAVCLAYLVLWWRSLNPVGTVWQSVAWTLPALAAATLVSLLVGHAVMVTALAVIAHETALPLAGLRRGPHSRWRMLVAAALAFAAGAALLFATSRGELREQPARVPAGRAPTTGMRVLMLGVDGFDVEFVERLAVAGRVPRLSRLAAGARALLAPADEADPARTWTSIATGQTAAVHGVSGIESRRVSGLSGTMPATGSRLAATLSAATDLLRLTRPVVTTAFDRRAKAVWEVAAEYGRQTAVVAWWATWPAPDSAGIVLSDRATLRLDRGGTLDAEVAPPALYDELRAVWSAMRNEARERARQAFPDPENPTTIALRRAAELDSLHLDLARRVARSDTDLIAVYLPGLDIAQYALLTGPDGAGLPPAAAASRVEALERYYEFLDGLIEPIVDQVAGGALVALITDAGRTRSRSYGLFALSGAAARPGVRMEASRTDVAPTVLAVLGVPLSLELPGRPLIELLTDEAARHLTVRTVPSYGQRLVRPRPPSSAPLDQEMLDRLRSLGYVR